MSEGRFMLLVWDLTVYSRSSSRVSSEQFGDVVDLFRSVWDWRLYEMPGIVGHGL